MRIAKSSGIFGFLIAATCAISCNGPNFFFSREHQYQISGWSSTFPGGENGGLSEMKRSNIALAMPKEAMPAEIEVELHSGGTRTFPCWLTFTIDSNVVGIDKNGKYESFGDIENYKWVAYISINKPIIRFKVTQRGKLISQKTFSTPILKWPAA